MSDGPDLVARPKDDTTAVTGIGIAESSVDLANGISNGDWVEGGLGALGVGLEVLSMVIDPIGTIASYGVSWLIEHVKPLKEALDWLAGDPPVIRSFSETWANVAAEVAKVAADHGNEAKAGTAGWTGQSADAYRRKAAETADAVSGAGTLADGISAGVMIMGEVVAAVRELVRDLVAEIVGKLIAWALEAVATLGFGTPVIVAQATAAISKVVTRIADLVRKLVKTIGNVAPRIRKVIDKLDEIIAKLGKLGRKADGGTSPSPATTPDGFRSPDGKSPSGTTSPSSTSPNSTTPPDGTTSTSPVRSGDTPEAPGNTSPQSASDLYRKPRGGGNNPQPWPPERRDPNLEYWPDTGQLKRTPENIRKVMAKYGVRLEPGAKPRPDANLQGAHGKTEIHGQNRVMRISPRAFVNEEQLARTLYHENVHVRQINENGGRYPTDIDELERWEDEAWDEERRWWDAHTRNGRQQGDS
ncbi:MAG: hypothetical protein ABW224_15725 [Kibdelosporangium sp.]